MLTDTISLLNRFEPFNEQEATDRLQLLAFLKSTPDAYLRSNLAAHMTASSWVINKDASKVLMVYHKLYDSWSWTGGHADGCEDLLSVAIRECREETGLQHVHPVTEELYSLEILPVNGHEKRGLYVPSHLHMNVTFLLQADETAPLRVCEAENSGVQWFSPDDAVSASTEPWFRERIYSKLNKKLAALKAATA